MDAVSKLVVLLVLDGFGVSPEKRGNAIAQAGKPHIGEIEKKFPFTALAASAGAVGLPWGEAGNSEVGHLTMGAGRVIYNHLPRIITAIRDGSFFENEAFLGVTKHVNENKSSLHLLGLVSSGSVHSYIDHLYALLELARREKVERVFVHAITDGKDAPPKEGAGFIARLDELLKQKYPQAVIASLIGRFFGMDRDEKWERIERAYNLLTKAGGVPFENAAKFIESRYKSGASDDVIDPAFLQRSGESVGRVKKGDGLIIFNFREDSVREIAAAFAADNFTAFHRDKISDLQIATMTEYEKNLPGAESAFAPLAISWPLARVLSATGKKQMHIAESEKYAHVTYFFNGGEERPFPGEDRLLLPSLAVEHYDERPQMKALEVTDKIIGFLGEYDFILGNLANADMIGHTGNFTATVKAIEILDEAVGRIAKAVLEKNGVLIIVGDHGNAEKKMDPISGEPLTEHTINPVPFYLVAENYRLANERQDSEIEALKKEAAGILTDVAPTILDIMQLDRPKEMTGKSLLPMLRRQR